MGEAWSDWFASDLQVRDGLKTDDARRRRARSTSASTRSRPAHPALQALDCPVGVDRPGLPRRRRDRRRRLHVRRLRQGRRRAARSTPTARSGPRRCGTCARRWRSRSASDELGLELAEILVTDGMRALAARADDARHAQRDPRRRSGRLRRRRCTTSSGTSSASAGWATSPPPPTAPTPRPAEDFSTPPDPDGPTGTVTGVVTDADSGLPLAGVQVGFGGHTTDPAFGDYLADDDRRRRAATRSRTCRRAPTRSSPSSPTPATTRSSRATSPSTTDATTTRDAAMRRDWAALGGGADGRVRSATTPARPSAAASRRPSTSRRARPGRRSTPTAPIPGNPHAGPPTVVLELPQTIDVTSFLVDPSAGCGDGASATTREYHDRDLRRRHDLPARRRRHRANEFTDDDIGTAQRARRRPARRATASGSSALTLLSPLRVDPECAPTACSGTDFIDLSEFEVLGGPPNVLPVGHAGGRQSRRRRPARR